jgi:hypothetical protein
MTLESKIDELYRLPLAEFTAARNALAKTLTAPDKERVRTLAKPTVVPWAVNQLYWRSRPAYDKLMKSGDQLRAAQLAALDGRREKGPDPGDAVRNAVESHRAALAEAVRHAIRLAAVDGAKPDADDLSRMLESLSLAPSRPDHPGRLTELIRPAGFEALAGISPAAFTATILAPKPASSASAKAGATEKDRAAAAEAAAAERKREQEHAARKRAAEAEVNAAERAFEQAQAAERRAKEAYEESERLREAAKVRLTDARKALART